MLGSTSVLRARRNAALLCVAALTLTACAGTDGGDGTGTASNADRAAASVGAKESAATISTNVRRGASSVGLDRRVQVNVANGTLQEVTVAANGGDPVAGELAADRASWRATGNLAAGTKYTITSSAVDADGVATEFTSGFTTRQLTLDEQTFPSFAPLPGDTVGVGMPAVITFDVPITDRASIEKHLKVASQPAQPGGFHWMSDTEVHWRPQNYWKPGTKVTVTADIGGVPAGNGIYGQKDRTSTFTVGDAMVSKVDIGGHQMKVFRNGTLIKTLPVTTGEQPKFTTRSGTKVIMEKNRRRRMNSETVGIDPNSADGYDLDDVEYAMRLTSSGEFIHAAPWSVGSQGRANVSHGCTGLSTANAGWLYENTKIGDVFEYVGSNKPMTLDNGYGDWNTDFTSYGEGSAL